MAWLDQQPMPEYIENLKSVSKDSLSKQPSDITISRNKIKKSPSPLHLDKFKLTKVRKFAKKYNFNNHIGRNYIEQFQRISTSAQELLFPLFSSHRRPMLQDCVKRLSKISFIIYLFQLFVTYPLCICSFECENNAQLQSPKVVFGKISYTA